MKNITIITGNKNKLDEYTRYFKNRGLGITVTPLKVAFRELQSSDPETILLHKVSQASQQTAKPFIVDDTWFSTPKYGGFPGPYAEYINQTLGLNGWAKLFNEGDKIIASTRIAFYYLDTVHVFEGKIEGVLSFKKFSTNGAKVNKKVPINSLFYIEERQELLGDLVKSDENFKNHRTIALDKFVAFLQKSEETAKQEVVAASKRWNERSDNWDAVIADSKSYVNHENGFERFNKLALRTLDGVSGGNALDIGCGTGAVTRMVADNTALSVLGIDASKDMIEKALTKKQANTSFEVNDVFGLDPKKRRYEAIISRGVIVSHLPFMQVYDYLAQVTKLAKEDAYFIFDFITNIDNGKHHNTSRKNEFSLDALKKVLGEMGWSLVAKDGNSEDRLISVAFHKSVSGGVYFATGNPLKVNEILEQSSGDIKIRWFGIDVGEIKSDSIEEITKDKLIKSYAHIGKPVICSDGGIFIDALSGFPGPNSKQAAQCLGADGIIDLLKKSKRRKAIRRNCIGYYDGKNMKLFTAEVICEISNEVRKGKYKSYELDRILIPIHPDNPDKKTYSEISVTERVQFTELPQLVQFLKELKDW